MKTKSVYETYKQFFVYGRKFETTNPRIKINRRVTVIGQRDQINDSHFPTARWALSRGGTFPFAGNEAYFLIGHDSLKGLFFYCYTSAATTCTIFSGER